jgi:hypothetical protein
MAEDLKKIWQFLMRDGNMKDLVRVVNRRYDRELIKPKSGFKTPAITAF